MEIDDSGLEEAVLWWLPKEGFFNEAETGAGDYYDDECRQIE